jgi:Kef-type K+ transport system membrane component KefB
MPHGAEQLLLELFAIFVAAKVMGEILERLSLPAVLGEILAGAVLGPYALGWIQPSDTIQSVGGNWRHFCALQCRPGNQHEGSDPRGT